MSIDDRLVGGQIPDEAPVGARGGTDAPGTPTELDLDAIEADLADVEAELARLDEDEG
jgi:hypothetical protein